MLQLIGIDSPSCKKKLLDNLNPYENTWIISDLESKHFIQNKLLEKSEMIPDNAVLRASELWQKLISKFYPTQKIISNSFAINMIEQWRSEGAFPNYYGKNMSKELLKYCAQLLPVIVSNKEDHTLSDWWKENQVSYIRWGNWYEMSVEIFERFNELNLIPNNWSAAWLMLNSTTSLDWGIPLWVDLGSQLNTIESELFYTLGQSNIVSLIGPNDDWQKSFKNSFRSYSVFEKKELKWIKPEELDNNNNIITLKNFYKLTNSMSEVKFAVNKVRDWIELDKVDVSQIGILAPDVDLYWPSLKEYLDIEGINYSKDESTKLHDLLDVGTWLSKLNVEIEKFDTEKLMRSIFNSVVQPDLSYSEFKIYYSNIYDKNDISRISKVQSKLDLNIDSEKLLNYREFIDWASNYWSNYESRENLEIILKYFMQDVSYNFELKLSLWLNYLEQICSIKEKSINQKSKNGIKILNFHSSEWSNVTHCICLGLTEQNLKVVETSGILLSDVNSLEYDLGIVINLPEHSKSEFEFEWLMKNSLIEFIATTSETDFFGEVHTPSVWWLKNAIVNKSDWKKVFHPPRTRWDQVQEQKLMSILTERNISSEEQDSIITRLYFELGRSEWESWKLENKFRMSVSQLENYETCPFKVYASKMLHLNDQPDVDLDIDHLSKGSLLHNFLEILVKENAIEKWSENSSADFFDKYIIDSRKMSKLDYLSDSIWNVQKNKLIDLGIQFLKFEKHWNQLYPKSKILDTEVKTECWLNLDNEQFEDKSSLNSWQFVGKIDRVDGDGNGNYSVIDYKSGSSGLTHHTSWLNNHSYQLALYSYWIENGFSPLPEGKVQAAVYYQLKDFQRNKGMILDSGVEGFIECENRYHKIKDEEKINLFLNTTKKTVEIIDKIQNGHFHPNPEKGLQTCDSCQWDKICRAPHLN